MFIASLAVSNRQKIQLNVAFAQSFFPRKPKEVAYSFEICYWLTVTRDILTHEFLNPWIIKKAEFCQFF